MKKWLLLLFTVLLSVGVLLGCSSNEAEDGGTNDESEEQVEEVTEGDEATEEEAAEGASFPVTVKDATGEEITVEAEPESIITLTPSNTEILYALDLLDKVIAVTDNDDFPEGIQDTKDSIGGMEFDVEKILSLQPDIVLANALNVSEGIEQLRNAGLTVVVTNGGSTFDEVYSSIEMVASVTGKAEEGQDIVNSMKERINVITEKAAQINEEDQVKVWVEIWPAPDLFTTGKGTFMHEMLEMIHAVNAAGDQEGWPNYTEEDAVSTNPDVIITTYGHWEGMETAVEDVISRPAWQEVSAVKSERVYNIEANIVERPGPRLVEGVEKLAELIYPEIFAQ
ncbi:ABC transporter substrate-binding protein [Anaerobacillus sp. MEB173]|uniref:ABC transporter substrate-binding protein n=1 Tax=Anaerobacillus sp. MEB173 TaxID=3383345 RepID=UPI003F8DB0EB